MLIAGAARAQDAPDILIGVVEISRLNIGGQTAESRNLKFTDLKALGTWTFQDKGGQHGAVYVKDLEQTQWKDKNLVVKLGKSLPEVKRVKRFKSGETALILDDLDADAIALLRQGNYHAPLDEQLKLKWQQLGGGKIRLTITKGSAGTLRLAPGNAQISVTLTRNGEELAAAPVKAPNATRPLKFETLIAGAIWQRDFDLGRYAGLSKSGHYQATINYQLPAQNGGTDGVTVLQFSDKFEFDVKAK